ncbi:CHASE3 domain-containing protein [Roseateles violae]|uniref:CHASE3 domain-containing protein n=1 Tax=Roseateles violae TaxID=3058042 RepID=A0ABT8DWM4_9BURK|nr:CHASE3 domain-containing protein [Pelomonas sp. PFR6]MDN3922613.1 CHASE3 domain-containing protein [Pelomonas sp. PFR6]
MKNRLSALLERLQKSTFAFPLAVLAAAAMLVISEASYSRAQDTLADLVQMGRARLLLYSIMARSADAETAQRGFLLTGKPEYLAPYEEAADDLSRALKDLKNHYAERGDLSAQRLHRQLEEAVITKMGELAEAVQRQRAGRPDAALELVQAGLGRDQMDLIRSRSEELLHLQNQRVASGRSQVYDALLLNRIGVAAMTAISLLALAMFLRQSRALAAQRDEQARAIAAERDQLEWEVGKRTAELTELATHLQSAREDERNHLARELHDELGALLTAAKLETARLKPRLAELAPDLLERLAHLTETLNSGIALKRRIIEDLRPSSLSNLGLLPALEIQAREFGERLEIPVHTELQPVRLSPRAELTVYRLVQEALTNIAKYAKAREVRVRLVSTADGQARVEVRDDGQGFDPQAQARSSHGLVGMRYRVAAEGGSLKLSSSPGQGTVLTALLPQLPAAEPAPAPPSMAPESTEPL